MFRRLVLLVAVALAAGGLAACRSGAPPASSNTCIGSAPAEGAIDAAFARFGPTVQAQGNQVAKHESGCDPCAFNPRQSNCAVWNPGTAKGLFQLLGHDDLIFAACPNPWGIISWQNPYCNALAASFLYQSEGGWHPAWTGAIAFRSKPAGFVLVSAVVRSCARTKGGRYQTVRPGTTASTPRVCRALNRGYRTQDAQAVTYWNAVQLWNATQRWDFVVASNYAQGLIDAQAARRVPQRGSGGGGGVPVSGACAASAPAGFPSSIIARESGGDPNARNGSSGAFGCAQILPSHFSAGGGCAGQSYAQCWATLWAGGAGSSNWAATR